MADKTTYAQSLMHMIKGNLGTGILAMPASFAHTGLINAIIGLPALCLISTYCVHLLVQSTRQLETKSKGIAFKYPSLAKHSFKHGPERVQGASKLMCRLVDATLLVAQLGVCCVFIVFVSENIHSILASNRIHASKTLIIASLFPATLLLSFIRTLKRLAIASAFANLLQAVGISIIIEYLTRDLDKININERDNFRPFNEVALGFGSAMYAFEGISVVLPVYTRMKNQDLMGNSWGVVNVSYGVLLLLYFSMGLFGYLKFGHNVRDSITLNLPPEPLYDVVRAIFASAVLLTYPLQFYVPNEIIWNWWKKHYLVHKQQEEGPVTNNIRAIDVIPSITVSNKFVAPPSLAVNEVILEDAASLSRQQQQPLEATNQSTNMPSTRIESPQFTSSHSLQEYCCRTILVVLTFVLAVSVPKLNLLMDLIGSITGTVLSLILPGIIHLVAFWDEKKGFYKASMIAVDSVIIIFGTLAGISGTIFSVASIIESSNHN